ncbi:PfkB family carbohydrate kinase [Mesorhizobium sp. M1403]|uniref:PfkB family carbohydrate kinase n=1 Tax=Mesorhizobium sp. M1403 TaxID=2957097 RepID=UPI0033368A78
MRTRQRRSQVGWRAVQDLSTCLNIDVLRTPGGDGAEVFAAGERISFAALPAEVSDTTAAGDCFVGALASALDRGLSNKAAVGRAVTAAGISCSPKGGQSSIPFAAEKDQWCLQA